MNTTIIQGDYLITDSIHLESLTIEEGAVVKAPEGKFVILTVDGIGLPFDPGQYTGDIRLTVCDEFVRSSMRFGEKTVSSYRSGVCVDDGKIQDKSSVFPIVRGGSVTDHETVGVEIESREWDFNGFYLTGKTNYRIADSKITLIGDGTDDFVGLGAAIAAAGETNLVIDNCKIQTTGITRGTLFVGDHAEVTVNDSEFSTESYVPTPAQKEAGAELGRMMEPPWAIGLEGYGCTMNIAGHGRLNINRCHFSSNNWGVCSVDGAIVNRMNIKDSLLEITGKNGYGCFSICDDFLFDYKAFGDYGCYHVIDHSTIRVPYAGVLMSLGNAGAEFTNGSIVESGRFGAFIHRNSGGILRINKGAAFKTKASTVVVKGSNTSFEFDGAILESENGTILQLMDNDDVGMCMDPFLVPVGEADVRDQRDLTVAVPDEDVFVTMSDMTARGNMFNSTTNLMACNRRLPAPPDAPPTPPVPEIPMGPDGKPVLRGFVGEDLMGAKNLQVQLKNATLVGQISAATAAYADGVTQIDHTNREQLSNITQTPAVPVNNGVIISLDSSSVWEVTGTCYMTSLTISDGARICGAEGMPVQLTVDGVETSLLPGTYTGLLKLSLQN